jgi:hypothetical protein
MPSSEEKTTASERLKELVESKAARRETKREYSELFNQLLGTNIDWTKLSLHELTQLAVLFNNPEVLLKRLGVKLQNVAIRRRLIQLVESLGFKGPFVELLKDVWGEGD